MRCRERRKEEEKEECLARHLGALDIYTCRGENQSLQDVRQGDDALDTRVLINHYKPVHLERDEGNQQKGSRNYF